MTPFVQQSLYFFQALLVGGKNEEKEVQWHLDLTKCQGTGEIDSLYRGSFPYIYYYWAEKYRSLYRGLRYIEAR